MVNTGIFRGEISSGVDMAGKSHGRAAESHSSLDTASKYGPESLKPHGGYWCGDHQSGFGCTTSQSWKPCPAWGIISHESWMSFQSNQLPVREGFPTVALCSPAKLHDFHATSYSYISRHLDKDVLLFPPGFQVI